MKQLLDRGIGIPLFEFRDMLNESQHNNSEHNDVMTSLETLQESMCNKDSEGIFSKLESFQKKNNQVKKDFSIFNEEKNVKIRCKNVIILNMFCICCHF